MKMIITCTECNNQEEYEIAEVQHFVILTVKCKPGDRWKEVQITCPYCNADTNHKVYSFKQLLTGITWLNRTQYEVK